jgi:hypothetical protein
MKRNTAVSCPIVIVCVGAICTAGPTIDTPTSISIWKNASFAVTGVEANTNQTPIPTLTVSIYGGTHTTNPPNNTLLGSKTATVEDDDNWYTDSFAPTTGGWPVGTAFIYAIQSGNHDTHAFSFVDTP